jgi:prepilin-type N-terminal cleavage/methylation domain-containing protein
MVPVRGQGLARLAEPWQALFGSGLASGARIPRFVPRVGRGFTLIELVMGLAVTAVLMGAMVASVAIASRSIDPGAGPAGRTVQGAGVLEQIEADLALALGFTEQTAAAATFTVPDRNGDGAPETVRYCWMGLADGRLMKQVNAGTPAAIAQDVRQFNLTYLLKTVEANPSQDDGGGKGGGGPGNTGHGQHKHPHGQTGRDGRQGHHQD